MVLKNRDIGLILSYGFVFGLMVIYQMSNVFSGGVFIVLITFVGLICFINNLRTRVNSIFLPALLLTIFMLVNTLIGNHSNIDNLLNTLLRIALWFWVYNIGTYFNNIELNNKKIFVCVIIYSLISLVIESGNISSDYSEINKFYEITTIYFLLLILPFVFCIHNKKIRMLLSILIGIVCILSFKRTILLTLILLAFTWLILLPKIEKKKKILIIIICGLIFFFIYNLANNGTFISIIQIWIYRFIGKGNTTMLGARGLTYSSVLSLMSKSNFIEWLFGHGYNTVSLASSTGFSAHNDFLEILYDYGIFALVLYICILYNLLKDFLLYRKFNKTVIGSINTNNEYEFNSFALISSVVIVVFAGMFSHLITYPTHFMLISLFWGWILPKNTILH